MDTSPEAPEPQLPPSLRLLKRLVMALTAVMIGGFLVLIVALVMRLSADGPSLPDRLPLPEGSEASAFTQGSDWFAVVTTDDRILIYHRLTGQLRQTLLIE